MPVFRPVCPVHTVVVNAKVLALSILIHCSLLLPCWSVCCFLFCYAAHGILSGLAVVLVVRIVLVAMLCLSSWCLVNTIVLLILMVPYVGLQCVTVVYPDHTYFLLVFLS